MQNRCLGCYQELEGTQNQDGYHGLCSRKLFGTDFPPVIEFGQDDLESLAKESINKHLGITGVQPKITLNIEKFKSDPNHRMVIADLWGNFILKPSTKRFLDLPVIEDLTMHMAASVGIATAKHGLVRLKSGELAYITRRFDREKKGKKISKIAVEDFCQLSELLTERKYKTSAEKAGKVIQKFSSQPGLDIVSYFDILLFSFLIGNADMHLKNFSLLTKVNGDVVLAPAYDLISTKLLPIDDSEETALTVNGKKSRIKRDDFEAMAVTLKISKKVVENRFFRLAKQIPTVLALIELSFLKKPLKVKFAKDIHSKCKTLELL